MHRQVVQHQEEFGAVQAESNKSPNLQDKSPESPTRSLMEVEMIQKEVGAE